MQNPYVVWKFPLTVFNCTPSPVDGPIPLSVEMPAGASILKMDMQHDYIMAWALCDPAAPKQLRHFYIVGTGWTFDLHPYLIHRATIFDGPIFVWHIFEDIRHETV